MSIIQISKIQQRAGDLVDLPQLDEAEFGFATDEKRLFIGKEAPNENIEVLTSYSNISFSQIEGSVGNLDIDPLTVDDGQVLTYDGNNWVNRGGDAGGLITLGNVSNVKINGGAIGYVLETDGTGNLSWTPKSTITAYIQDVTKSDLANGIPTTVTTTEDNFFTNNAQITISGVVGMTQLNGNSYYVQVITSNSFGLYTTTGTGSPVDSTFYGTFPRTTVTATNSVTDRITVGSSSAFSANNAVIFQGSMANTGIVEGDTYYVYDLPTGTSMRIATSADGNASNIVQLITASGLTSNVYVTGGRAISSTGGSGTVAAGGSNTQIQFNNTNLLDGSTNFTFDYANNIMTLVGNANVTNLNATTLVTSPLFTGTLTTAAQPNITSLGNTTNVTVAGNLNPSANVTYNLGNNTSRWNDLYLAGSTVYLGNATITSNASGVVITNASGGSFTVGGTSAANGAAIVNGNSSVIVAANSNVNITAGGNTSFVVSNTGVAITGTANITGNANVGNLGTATLIATTGNITTINSGLMQNGNSNITITANGNISVQAAGGTTEFVVTSTGVNVAGTLNATGNANTGNLGTGIIVATGNITGANVITTGTANIGTLAVTGTSNLNAIGNITITGGTSGQVIQTNGSGGLSFVTIDTWRIQNGTSNVSVAAVNGNVTIAVAGVANVATFTSTGMNIAGTGNITGNANVGNLGTAGLITATGNITGGNLTTSGALSVTGNANIGNIGTAGQVIATGNITGGNLIGPLANGNSNVNIPSANGNVSISVGGTANVVLISSTGAAITGTANITGNANVGNLGTAGIVTATGTITGGNLITTGNANVGTLRVSGTSNLGPVGNVAITGGSANQILKTNGSGTLSWTDPTGGYYLHTQSSGSTTWTIVHNLNNQYVSVNPIDSTGNSYLGRYDFPTITYTNANAVTLTFTSSVTGYCAVVGGGFTYANGNGSASPAGLNTYVQFNDAGTLGGQPSFTFDKITGTVGATLFVGSGANLTSLNASNVTTGTLAQARLANSSLTINGTSVSLGGSATITANTTQTLTFGSYLTGTSFNGGTANTIAVDATTTNTASKVVARDANGSFSANVITASLTGAATTAGTVTTAAQPNITSVGTLSSLSVTGNVSAGNVSGTLLTGTLATASQPNVTSLGTLTGLGVNGTVTAAAFTANTGVFGGNGAGLTNLAGANVTGTVASATNASALLQNTSTSTTVYPTFSTSSANGNSSAVINTSITANLGNASITATTFVGALSGAATTAGTVTTAAQPNITSVGTLTGLTVSGATSVTGNSAFTVTNITSGANTTAGYLTGNWILTTGSRLQATYADLAEYYSADEQYSPGTVLEFGGTYEVTLASDATNRVAGVVSTDPAYAMNAKCPGPHPVPIALQGRVPVKVRGKIKKGDMMISGGGGYARPTSSPHMGTVIGKALQDFDGIEGVIEIAVGRL